MERIAVLERQNSYLPFGLSQLFFSISPLPPYTLLPTHAFKSSTEESSFVKLSGF